MWPQGSLWRKRETEDSASQRCSVSNWSSGSLKKEENARSPGTQQSLEVRKDLKTSSSLEPQSGPALGCETLFGFPAFTRASLLSVRRHVLGREAGRMQLQFARGGNSSTEGGDARPRFQFCVFHPSASSSAFTVEFHVPSFLFSFSAIIWTWNKGSVDLLEEKDHEATFSNMEGSWKHSTKWKNTIGSVAPDCLGGWRSHLNCLFQGYICIQGLWRNTSEWLSAMERVVAQMKRKVMKWNKTGGSLDRPVMAMYLDALNPQ